MINIIETGNSFEVRKMLFKLKQTVKNLFNSYDGDIKYIKPLLLFDLTDSNGNILHMAFLENDYTKIGNETQKYYKTLDKILRP
jgi:hypothetical protein